MTAHRIAGRAAAVKCDHVEEIEQLRGEVAGLIARREVLLQANLLLVTRLCRLAKRTGECVDCAIDGLCAKHSRESQILEATLPELAGRYDA